MSCFRISPLWLLFSALALIALFQLFDPKNPTFAVRAQFADSLTSGTILQNLWGRKRRHSVGSTKEEVIRTKRQFADGLTSGTILQNLWGRRKRTVRGDAMEGIMA